MTRPDPDFFIDLEHQVWQAIVDGDADADRHLLADTFVGLYPTGPADRDQHVAQFTAAPVVSAYELDPPRAIAVGEEATLLCYRARYRSPGSDAWHTMYVSSLWQQIDGRWQNIFSQDTPAA